MDIRSPPQEESHRGDFTPRLAFDHNWITITDENLFDPAVQGDANKALWQDFGHTFFGQLREITGSKFISEVCFLEVVTVIPPALSRGVMFTPKPNDAEVYQDLVRKLFDSGNAIADHPVFGAGLPLFTSNSASGNSRKIIKTETELLALIRESKELGSATWSRGYYGKRLHDLADGASVIRTEPFKRRPSLHCTTLEYEERSPDAAIKRYGGNDSDVYTNFSVFISLLSDRRTELRSLTGCPLDNFYAVPLTYWSRQPDGSIEPTRQGSFFLGTSGTSLGRGILPKIEQLVVRTTAVPFRSKLGRTGGVEATTSVFAHQTSAAVHSLVEGVRKKADVIQGQLGDLFIAELSFLHAVINSYRDPTMQQDLRIFPYPWKDGLNPLALYRDVGIQMGLSRAMDAFEPEICDVGSELIAPDQDSDPLPEWRRRFFDDIPECQDAAEVLKHTGTAVLIMLALKQAVYHTIRAQCFGQVGARVKVSVQGTGRESIFSCEVDNVEFDEHDRALVSRDEGELTQLASSFTSARSPYAFSTKGPRNTAKGSKSTEERGRWLTIVTVQRK